MLDYDEQDAIDAEEAQSYRALATDLPERPGTRR